ncbi:hypothetical protein UWK_02210 [Desulfocapsa sulfexigens DSM 10523]|uniref:Uncharacterized protein n=1 Tax=Desulfocapsa sulfexigens (strain DSM 10523 / SB164P1) TaxID=1167006 RepID=M1PQS4_DESSD|nr:hypothetical protein [Desulfocapsa sulfexigens]AGF78751.1 hypothetical protein UWK_02210 [Desulfocapsa sulfexigens DSM 10523]
MRSLRSLSTAAFLGTALLLAMLIITGYSQNRLMGTYNSIVEDSEKTIFLYSTIREQATEGLLSENSTQLLAAAREVEQLNTRYIALLDNRLIPAQYKLSFLKKIDLEEISIHLKKSAETTADRTLALKTLGLLRQINSQFLQFDRIVVGEMKNRIMYYQKKALVLMGLIIFLTTFTLIILYKKSVQPLIFLSKQSHQALTDKTRIHLKNEHKNSVEVQNIIHSFNQLLLTAEGTEQAPVVPSRRETEFSAIVNEVTNRLNGIINYSQLLADYCEAEQVGGEQKKILYKIIENGEKSAAILQKSLNGGEI